MFNRLPAVALLVFAASAARDETNYDESKVRAYALPDPLVLASGERVRDARTWYRRRRPELLALFSEYAYGRTPKWTRIPEGVLLSSGEQALGGKAVRKEIRIYPAGKDGPGIDLLLYLPAAARGPVPACLGLNFGGDHTVSAGPGIRLGEVWMRDPATKIMVKRPARERSRGRSAEQWQVERIGSRGYGLATIYYGDIEPDFPDSRQYGMGRLFPHAGPAAGDEWGSIGVWAWGLSRALDYLTESQKGVDARRVMLVGPSRLGKTALWAAARDTRFAGAISNDSGKAGAALSRRPVYVASADEDLWSDPRGEFLSAAAAGPVYRLPGKQGLGTDRMPPLHQPIMHDIGYHIRAGEEEEMEENRRDFLRNVTSGAATVIAGAPAVLAMRDPNEVPGIAVGGVGTRGYELLREAQECAGTEIRAIADLYDAHLARAQKRAKNPKVRLTKDWEEAISGPDMDAVVIATPDFWHAPMTIAAAELKKDSYTEKGWCMNLDEAKKVRRAIREKKRSWQQKPGEQIGLQPQDMPVIPDYSMKPGELVTANHMPSCHVGRTFEEAAMIGMSVESYRRGCKVRWNAAKEEVESV